MTDSPPSTVIIKGMLDLLDRLQAWPPGSAPAQILDTAMPGGLDHPARIWLIDALRAARAPRQAPLFEFAGHCLIDGELIPPKTKGIALAWLVVASHQLRLPPVRVEWLGSHRATLGALGRAAEAAEGLSMPLAATIRAIGTKRGMLVLNHPPRVHCISQALVHACA